MSKVVFAMKNLNIIGREDNYMAGHYRNKFLERGFDVGFIGAGDHPPTEFLCDYFISYKTHIGIEKLAEIKKNKTVLVLIYPDTVEVMDNEDIDDEIALYDYILIVDSDTKKYEERFPSSKIVNFRGAVAPDQYDTGVPYIVGSTLYNWIFIGSYHERRATFAKILSKHNNGIIFGYEWEKCPMQVPWTGIPVYEKAFAMNSLQAVVSLNKPTYDHSTTGCFSARIYKIMASGCPVLTSYGTELVKEFKENRSILFYRNMDELDSMLVDPIEYFKPELLENVARNGKTLVLQNHTYAHRAIELMEILKL